MPNLKWSIHIRMANPSTYLPPGLRVSLSHTGETTWVAMKGLLRVVSIWAGLMWRCNEWTRQVLNLAGSQGVLIIGNWQSCSLSTGWVWYLGWEQKWKTGGEVRDAAESWRQEAGGVWGVLCASIQSQGDVSSSISAVNDWCGLVLKKQPWVSAKYLLEVTFARAIHFQYKISALESNWGGFCERWFVLQGA